MVHIHPDRALSAGLFLLLVSKEIDVSIMGSGDQLPARPGYRAEHHDRNSIGRITWYLHHLPSGNFTFYIDVGEQSPVVESEASKAHNTLEDVDVYLSKPAHLGR